LPNRDAGRAGGAWIIEDAHRSGASEGVAWQLRAAIFSNCFRVGIRQDAGLLLMGELEHKRIKLSRELGCDPIFQL